MSAPTAPTSIVTSYAPWLQAISGQLLVGSEEKGSLKKGYIRPASGWFKVLYQIIQGFCKVPLSTPLL